MDDLGWQQFEELVQTVLKIEFGFAVEAWGGTHDGGRDAYHPGPLPFLDKSSRQIGPFIFQCKFVEGANASGARPAGSARGE